MAQQNLQQTIPYWSYTKEKLFADLHTSEEGLSSEEAEKRIKKFGLNTLVKKKKNPFATFFLQFLNPLILILLFASLISVFLGEITEFIIIASIIFISGIIDFYQQYHAEKASEKLNQHVSITATVIRKGIKQEISIKKITVGDIIHLSVGDLVPADARLLSVNGLLVTQSVLTGESFPQEKVNLVFAEKSEIVKRKNCVFMGTNVISGEGEAIVCRVGNATEIGSIAKELVAKRPETEFDRGIKNFGLLVMKITFALTILVFFINAIVKHDILNSFLFAVALAVGLTPELLPMIITINLAKGALRMAKKGVIVKDLPAIQNFGSMDVLCTDKTGTLTEDKIHLDHVIDLEGKENENIFLYGYINSVYQLGFKSPLEQAIERHKQLHIANYKKIAELPFDFFRKRLSIVITYQGKHYLVTKGDPFAIASICTTYTSEGKTHQLSDTKKDAYKKLLVEHGAMGFRVLGVAVKEIVEKDTYTVHDEKEMTLFGLIAFSDPTKESAKEAVKLLGKNGITIKVLTGDNEFVTRKVCMDLELPVENVMTGTQLENLHEGAFLHAIKHATIFAGLNPSQKEQIILGLKKLDFTVGFLGDGINDAPSLKSADIGISVQNGVDVAKESADLILLHRDLHVLKDGVIEGRRTYANVMKYIMMGTSSNFGNMISVAGASFFLPFLPMLPVQILLNNLLYDFSQLTIPSDNVDIESLHKPRKWNLSFIKHFMLVFGPVSSLFDFLTFFLLLFLLRVHAQTFQTSWFVESLFTQTLIIFSIRTKKVPFFLSKPSGLLVVSSLAIAYIAISLPFTPIAKFFSFTPPPLPFYALLFIITACYFTLVELIKNWFYKTVQMQNA